MIPLSKLYWAIVSIDVVLVTLGADWWDIVRPHPTAVLLQGAE